MTATVTNASAVEEPIVRAPVRARATIGGRYTLLGVLGEGGMSTVYRARDRQLGREVAVKVLRPQFGADTGFAERFHKEAQRAASLAHPNVVRVYDYGVDDRRRRRASTDLGPPGLPIQYIVMELVDGEDLATLLRERGKLPPSLAVQIGADIASALEAAHRSGIVHRDVKPANILLTRDGVVKVADFGIARALSEASMTLTGMTLGSVHYVSPEQARGDDVTPASDLYSLGIVVYEMLTGRRPFEGDNALGVALKRLSEDPVPPSIFDRTIPRNLERAVTRALERDPAERFWGAEAFREALLESLPAAAPSAALAAPPTAGTQMLVRPAAATLSLGVSASARGAARGDASLPTHALSRTAIVAGRRDPPRRPDQRRRRYAPPPGALRVAMLGLLLLAAGALAAGVLASRGSTLSSPTPRPAVAAAPMPTATATSRSTPRATPKPTAKPTPRPTTRATPQPTPRPAVGVTGRGNGRDASVRNPAGTVGFWYGLIEEHQFDRATAMWTARMKSECPPASCIYGRFRNTVRMEVRRSDVVYVSSDSRRARVAVDLVERLSSGQTRRWVGSWDLVRSGSGWLLDDAHF